MMQPMRLEEESGSRRPSFLYSDQAVEVEGENGRRSGERREEGGSEVDVGSRSSNLPSYPDSFYLRYSMHR